VWFQGARPRTLPAAVVPVAVGTAAAEAVGSANIGRALLALVVSLALQVGVNYANDYSDGVRGTDEVRVGPVRLVGQKLASPAAVKRAALLSLVVAAAAGLVLALMTSLWLLAVGAAAIAAAWFYTGGPRPYGYAGLGEAFVFVFFGLVAVIGTTFVQIERVALLSVVVSVPVGLLAVALLVVNNLRDIPGDTVAGKRTLAVRVGDASTRKLYCACVLLTLGAVPVTAVVDGGHPFAVLALASGAVAISPLRQVIRGAAGRELISVLGATGKVQLAFGALLSLGLLL
jgi:1,4-dihydroxy-2-naphthoate polyprenyltransferase